MAGVKYPRILYFIAGTAPTDEEFEAALNLGSVVFLNVSMIGPNDGLEPCDAVAGPLVPASYKNAGKPVVKTANDAIKLMRDMQKARNVPVNPATVSDPAFPSALGAETPLGQETGGGPTKATGWTPNT